MATDPKIKPGPRTVRKLDVPETGSGFKFEYHGDGYLPLGAMIVRAPDAAEAYRTFQSLLSQFGYAHDDDDYADDECSYCVAGEGSHGECETHGCCV